MMLNVRIREDYHPELFRWLNAIPKGERSVRVRDALRRYLKEEADRSRIDITHNKEAVS